MRLIILQIFAMLFTVTVTTAQTDSLNFVTTNWQLKQVHPEVKWMDFHFSNGELFHSNQHISILEIAAKPKMVQLQLAYSDSLDFTSTLAMREEAIAGVNGSYFMMRGKDPDNHPQLTSVPKSTPANIHRNRSTMYLKVDGTVITPNQEKSAHVKRYPRGALVFDKRELAIVKVDTTIVQWEDSMKAKNIITSGPVLLSKHQQTELPNDKFCAKRHPRTAIGVRADGSVVCVVVDGRSKDAAGMNLHEMQQIMAWLGCVDALNLDGGGSSTMYVANQPFKGVVNCPSDNKQFNHEGEREVANALLITEK